MFFKDKKREEPPPSFIIKPNADGSWYISRLAVAFRVGFYHEAMDGNYATAEDAKSAIENLKRDWIKIP